MNSKSSDQTHEGRTRAGANISLGEQLRLAREARGITLREISEQTRISVRYLEAIEADDYRHLPGGIFNRSFIKAYARYVKFDEDEALEAYMRTAREHGESPDEVATTPHHSRVYTDGDTNRSPLVTALLSAVILGILILGVYAGLHWYRRTEKSVTSAGNAAPATGAGSSSQAAVQNAPQSPAATREAPSAAMQIQIKARGEPVWIRMRADEGEQTETTLSADQTLDFAPARRLS
ncbi:MAG: helix-turn-helix domain-containing protein, partial [Acidobacteria bacterium]|nr:helix-turn-helix domain-containing protein [Acidobacteriota bacterium]